MCSPKMQVERSKAPQVAKKNLKLNQNKYTLTLGFNRRIVVRTDLRGWVATTVSSMR